MMKPLIPEFLFLLFILFLYKLHEWLATHLNNIYYQNFYFFIKSFCSFLPLFSFRLILGKQVNKCFRERKKGPIFYDTFKLYCMKNYHFHKIKNSNEEWKEFVFSPCIRKLKYFFYSFFYAVALCKLKEEIDI